MRKIIVLAFLSLDGVMQGPGGPEEDTDNGFNLGGWVAPFNEEESGELMGKQLERADLMLGRKTYDIFSNYWPSHGDIWPGVNEVKKYVLSNTVTESDWNNTEFVTSVDDVKKIKEGEGGDIRIWGSSKLVQLLLAHDLVDEFWLNIHPVVLGKGKKLFDDKAMPASFKIADSFITPKGVIMAHYKKAGKVETGTVGPE